MLLTRTHLHAPSRLCTRGLATSAARPNASNLMSILGASQPAAPSATSPENAANAPKLATRMGAMAFEGAAARQRTQLAASQERQSFQRNIHRRWNAGDVYAPHDLSGVEQKKWKLARKMPASDAFDTLGINPVNEYKNFTMMSEYMSEMGRIKHSRETGLRPVNQRKIAKAIRRAIGLGLMPSVHRHPLVLKKTSPGRFTG